ncbi:MAG: hypothetical protein HYX65_01815 [Gemmatimonadetes bacterium]|nr:hypothetical protein [Gemmatimonadota bacterium]
MKRSLTPLLLVADVEAQSRSAPANARHVEDHTTTQCRAPHDAACVVCQHLLLASAPPPADPPGASAGRSDAPRRHTPVAVRRAGRGESTSRAPPTLA